MGKRSFDFHEDKPEDRALTHVPKKPVRMVRVGWMWAGNYYKERAQAQHLARAFGGTITPIYARKGK